MTSLQQKLLAAFEGEYRSILEAIRSAIVGIESTGAPLAGPALNDVFRQAHTLKGSAHVVGLAGVVTLAHRLESLFAKVRDQKVQLGPADLRLIMNALDTIEDTVLASQNGRALPLIEGVVAGLDALNAGGAAAAPTLALVKAADPAPPTPPPPVESTGSDSETVRLSARHLDQLLATSGELLKTVRASRQVDRSVASIGGGLESVAREWDLLRKTSLGALQSMHHSADYARAAQFIEFVGAQVAPLLKSVRSAKTVRKQIEWDLQHLGDQLQDDVRQARTVPAETILGGFNKMARDLAAQLNKQIEFRLTGLSVEADRGVLQQLKAPLMHLLRNAIDHGLEPATLRATRGKSAVGRVSIKLATEHGRLVVAIADDGQGLSESKIRERIVANGWVSAAEANGYPSARVFAYIFHPGFSTASEVSDISGRGLGMSIVEEAVKSLQGTIRTESTAGAGTTFTLSVPITLTNHHVVLVHHGEQTYAIPCAHVESLRRVRSGQVITVDGQPSLLIQGQPVPIVSLGGVLESSRASVNINDDTLSIVILRAEGRHCGLAVDAISDKSEALIKNLSTDLRRDNIFGGAIIQGDGRVVLVLDARAVIARGTREAQGRALQMSAPPPPSVNAAEPSQIRILVVDDSITTRTLERGILEAHGFTVSLAVDGVDALAKLHGERFDLVISDVEMPRMDGFHLVAEIKKHPKLAAIPVIMVTSLDKAEDRERGLRLGANAYVSKQKFDQGALLETIRQVL